MTINNSLWMFFIIATYLLFVHICYIGAEVTESVCIEHCIGIPGPDIVNYELWNLDEPKIITIEDRPTCVTGATPPPSRQNTTTQIQRLRTVMQAAGYDAYIILSTNDHQSSTLPLHDRRRVYMSGFTGAGDAVITTDFAAQWTDSRYFIQAEEQLDCNWILMKSGVSGTPTIQDWLAQVLQPGSKVTTDPRIATYQQWSLWNSSTALESNGISLEPHLDNLVDLIWDDQPQYPSNPVFVVNSSFTGQTWQQKLQMIRQQMAAAQTQVLVITAMDEVAWTLNLRGSDIPTTPTFRGYLLINNTQTILYIPLQLVTAAVENYLSDPNGGVTIKNYTEIWDDLVEISTTDQRVWLPSPYSYAGGVSQLIYQSVKSLTWDNVYFATSPVLAAKTRKNAAEVQAMRQAHVRDGAILSRFLATLERGIENGDDWDELRVVRELNQMRSQDPLYHSLSFGTIAGFREDSALPHYQPSDLTNKKIDNTSLLMLDSGGQYEDGTTDVTRTLHYGEPTDEMIRIYTSLLMGCIDLVTTVFPQGQTLSQLDVIIRAPLFKLGFNYGHGSTHGVGSFLQVHEAFHSTYHENFIGSQEPGYYRANAFGMRIENLVVVVNASLTDTTDGVQYLTFQPITFVPYEPKLINVSMLTEYHINWLNDYYEDVRSITGNKLRNDGHTEAYEWLLSKTEPITRSSGYMVEANLFISLGISFISFSSLWKHAV